MQADGVEHSGRCGVKTGWRGSFERFLGQALGYKATEAVQVDEVGEFEAVTEGATGGENRIPQAQRANLYTQINGLCGTHFAQEDTTSPQYSH